MKHFFNNLAVYLRDAMGANVIYEIDNDEVTEEMIEEGYVAFIPNDEDIIGFICPECGEVIYYEDYCEATENWMCCPVCFNEFEIE